MFELVVVIIGAGLLYNTSPLPSGEKSVVKQITTIACLIVCFIYVLANASAFSMS